MEKSLKLVEFTTKVANLISEYGLNYQEVNQSLVNIFNIKPRKKKKEVVLSSPTSTIIVKSLDEECTS
jgi:hypothetical protein